MKEYRPICECEYGPMAQKVELKPDFFSGFDPRRREEIVSAEVEFYRGITEKYSVDDRLEKRYIQVPVRDGFPVRVKIYKPLKAAGNLPAVIFIHGGGFITCSVETHDYVPSYISANANCICFSVDYRLSPEFKFPKGLEDCYDVAKYVSSHSDELGVDRARIAVAGDSSGGNFAAVLSQIAKKSGEISFNRQILIYPVTDLTGKLKKRSALIYAPVGAGEVNDAVPDFMSMYLPEDADSENPMISPLFGDLSNLPPALFIQAECDGLCDDGLYYAESLRESGVEVICKIFKGMPHAFILRTYEETFEALDIICRFINE